MISLEKRIEAIIQFGEAIRSICGDYKSGEGSATDKIFVRARIENPWFTEKNILMAFENWSATLERNKVIKWAAVYLTQLEKNKKGLNIAVVNAGNIPFVGLHDLLSVLLCGCNYIGKNATGDTILLPYMATLLCSVEPGFIEKIKFVSRLETMDAVIATGNNNSSRYFEYYFGKYPNIIRKNRNGAGVLSRNESKNQLQALGYDIFSYFGLGCRNISKLYVPAGYDFREFFEAIEDFKEIAMHAKYMNNFEYNNSVFLLKRIKFLQNGFLIIRNEKQIASPVSVLHYEEYSDQPFLIKNLSENIDQLQCIVAAENIFSGNHQLQNIRVDFGMTQSPELWDYADGVDTVKFLCENAI